MINPGGTAPGTYYIIAEADGTFRVKALTEIEQFNANFGTHFPE